MPPPVPPSVNAGPDDERETADFFRDGAGFVQVVRGAGNRNVEADGKHQFLERLAVFALVDGFGLGADHFDAVSFQRAVFVQRHRGVQAPSGRRASGAKRVCPSRSSFFISSFSRTMIFSTHSGVMGSM